MTSIVPRVIDVAALLATELAVPRLTLSRVVRKHPVTGDLRLYWISDGPYSTEPGDSIEVSFAPRLMAPWTYDWSRVAGADGAAGTGPTMSGPSSVNRGVLSCGNYDGGLNEWLTDGYEIDTVTIWYATYKQHGLTWADIEPSPVFDGWGVNPVRVVGKTIEFDVEGVEGRLDGVQVRDETWVGLGNALQFDHASAPQPAAVPHDDIQTPKTSFEVRALVRFDSNGVQQTVVSKGVLGGGWVLFRRPQDDKLQFDVKFDSGLRARPRTPEAVPAGVWLDVRGTWRGSDNRATVWVDGVLEDDETIAGQTYDVNNAADLTVGHDGSIQARHLDGLVAGLEIRIDQDRTDAQIAADATLVPLPDPLSATPTLVWALQEYPLDTAYSQPTPDGGDVYEMDLGGATWADTEMGDPSMRGEILPTALGDIPRADPVYTNRSMGVRRVHGGNGQTGDGHSVHGMGPADDAGILLKLDRGEPWVSATATFAGRRVIAGPGDDFEGLRAGQDIDVVTTGGANNGRRSLALDSTRGEMVVDGPDFAAQSDGTVTVTVAGERVTSLGIEFRAGSNDLVVPDIESTNYLDGHGTALTLGNTGSTNDGTYLPVTVAPGVVVLPGALTAMPAGREITLTRAINYAANVVTLHTYLGVTNRSYVVVPNDSTVPPLGRLKIGSTITVVGAGASDRVYTVVAAGTDTYGPRVVPNFLSPGLVATAVTLTVTERTTLASLAVRDNRLISHDEDVSFAGKREGGAVEVTGLGAGANTGQTYTIASGGTETELPVVDQVSHQAAGGLVVLEFDSRASTDITVYPSRSMVIEHQPYPKLAIAVRGCNAGGQYVETGGELIERVHSVYAGRPLSEIDLAATLQWSADDPHPRGVQLLAPTPVSNLYDQTVEPAASWGSDLGNKIEVAQHPVPSDLNPSALDLEDNFGVAEAGVQLPARRRPIQGTPNMVVVDDADVPGIVRELYPELVAIITRGRETYDLPITSTAGATVDDPPVPTLYSTTAGLAAAALLQAALYGVPRRAYELALQPSILLIDRRTEQITITDPDDPLLDGTPAILLGVQVGTSRIVIPCQVLV